MAEYSDLRTGPARPVLGLLLAAHPAPAGVVTALSVLLAVAAGRGVAGCLLAGAAVLSGQLSVGWSNDRVDLQRDVATGRRDKPLVTGAVTPSAVARAAALALAACVPLSLASGLLPGLAHLAAVGAAWSYNLWLKRTVLSWLPYALGFGLLPVLVAPAAPARLLVGGALLGVGAHFANVLPDLADDLATGVRGLPHRLGRTGAGAAAVLLLAAAAAVLRLGGWLTVALPVALVPVLRTRAVFPAVLALAAVDVLLLVHGLWAGR